MPNFQCILLATDFSETSALAAEYAVMMAKQFGASLHVVHALEVDIPMLSDGMVYLPPDYFPAIEKQAIKRLEGVISQKDRADIPVTPVLRKGSPYLEIVTYAQQANVDLIVLGTHGRGALGHLFMGNVAEKVVRKAPCAVLTVRPGQQPAEPPK